MGTLSQKTSITTKALTKTKKTPMKIDIKTARGLLMLVMLLLVGLSQDKLQAQTSVDNLIGDWVFNDGVSFTSIDPMFQKQIDTIPALRSKLVAVYSGRQMHFQAGGNYRTTLSDGRATSGTWQLQGTLLKIIDQAGTVFEYQLSNLSATTLTLIPIVAADTKSMITQWHFNKL